MLVCDITKNISQVGAICRMTKSLLFRISIGLMILLIFGTYYVLLYEPLLKHKCIKSYFYLIIQNMYLRYMKVVLSP